MAYNRDAAVKYAAAYWNIPCDDGIFWLTNERINVAVKRRELKTPESEGWKALFVKGDGTEPEKAVFRRNIAGKTEEKLINGWAGLADCAHYLSRCLTAGGAKVDERGVRSLVNTLQARPDTKTLCEKVAKERAQNVINTGIFKPGDMIGYFNVSPSGDFDGRQSYTHSTMYVGKLDKLGVGGVTCHTVSRYPPFSWVNDSWWLHDGYVYTLIHLSSDDVKADLSLVNRVAGWWQQEYGGMTTYLRIGKDGTARIAKVVPKSANELVNLPIDNAYWFDGGLGRITLIWRKSGVVESWNPASGDVPFVGILNGSITGKLKKLF